MIAAEGVVVPASKRSFESEFLQAIWDAFASRAKSLRHDRTDF